MSAVTNTSGPPQSVLDEFAASLDHYGKGLALGFEFNTSLNRYGKAIERELKYSPDQPRNEHGEWDSGGGSSSSESSVSLAGLPDGSRLGHGRGPLGSKMWGVFDANDKLIWNLHDTPQQAVNETKQHLRNQAAAETERAATATREADIKTRLTAGGTATDADLKTLNLKPRSNFEYISPVVQRVFSIPRSKVRVAMGDALRPATTDSGARVWVADARQALSNAARYASKSDGWEELAKDVPSSAVEDELSTALDKYGEELLTALRSNMDEGGTIDKAFNPDQPRVPAGSPEGGEFAGGEVGKFNPYHDELGRFASGDGGGASTAASGSADPAYTADPEAHTERVLNTTQDVAQKLGYPPDKVVTSENDREFTVNGHKYMAAGEAEMDTGIVRMFPKQLPPYAVVGVAAHEVQHQRTEKVFGALSANTSDLLKDPNFEAYLKPDGTIRPGKEAEFSAKYPVYAQLNQDVNPQFSLKKMAADDGVSSYSRDYWDAWKKGEMQTDKAIHETLSEMAEAHYTTGKIPGTRRWVSYYKRLNKIYDSRWNARGYQAVGMG